MYIYDSFLYWVCILLISVLLLVLVLESCKSGLLFGGFRLKLIIGKIGIIYA